MTGERYPGSPDPDPPPVPQAGVLHTGKRGDPPRNRALLAQFSGSGVDFYKRTKIHAPPDRIQLVDRANEAGSAGIRENPPQEISLKMPRLPKGAQFTDTGSRGPTPPPGDHPPTEIRVPPLSGGGVTGRCPPVLVAIWQEYGQPEEPGPVHHNTVPSRAAVGPAILAAGSCRRGQAQPARYPGPGRSSRNNRANRSRARARSRAKRDRSGPGKLLCRLPLQPLQRDADAAHALDLHLRLDLPCRDGEVSEQAGPALIEMDKAAPLCDLLCLLKRPLRVPAAGHRKSPADAAGICRLLC